ncbi:hypothetical protein [Kineococcus sp. SYSU DK002]|uniref:hypothetical protein n=1 Tax=Kineococcus sp. SYSU DK002 TaxID=3383123 RepID=UPI003D7EA075
MNAHVAAAWPVIAGTLGARGRYVATFDAAEVVGEGLVNASLGRAPRPVPVLTRTSTVRVVLDVDPAEGRPFVVTAHPLLPLPGPDEIAPAG